MEKSPDAFRTISEVAEHLETPAHVLRFWESRFPQIRPVKRAGGRRYYRPADVALLTGIKRLLHDEGMTIRGVQKILREQGVRYVSGMADDATADDDEALEAALASSSGAAEAPPPLPAAEAEAAQVIALETALSASTERAESIEDSMPNGDDAIGLETAEDSEEMAAADSEEAPATVLPTPFSPKSKEPIRTTPPPRKTPADDGISDLFSRMVASTSTSEEDVGEADSADNDVEIIDFNASKSPPKLVAIDELETSEEAPFEQSPDSVEGETGLANEEAEEAPMAVWADDVPTDESPENRVGLSNEPGPTLRVTRIGAASNKPAPMYAAPKPHLEPEIGPDSDLAQTIASRLRATRADQLSHSDRGTLTVIRARARSLRDRLAAPPRLGH